MQNRTHFSKYQQDNKLHCHTLTLLKYSNRPCISLLMSPVVPSKPRNVCQIMKTRSLAFQTCPACCRRIAAGSGDSRSTDSNSIKVQFICSGGQSDRLGRARARESFKVCSTAQRTHLCWVLHGLTICAPSPPPFPLSSPSSHMFYTNVRSKPPSLPPSATFSPLPPPPCHTSQRRRIKKTHKSFPWLPSGLPGQESGREEEQRRGRLVGEEERGEGWRIFIFSSSSGEHRFTTKCYSDTHQATGRRGGNG